MWFRNARPYRLPGRLGIDASELSQRLSRRPFQPCRPVNPYQWMGGRSSDDATILFTNQAITGLFAYSARSDCYLHRSFEAR